MDDISRPNALLEALCRGMAASDELDPNAINQEKGEPNWRSYIRYARSVMATVDEYGLTFSQVVFSKPS